MAEHRVRSNGIIYIIPDDELFLKLKDGEAFIDDYGHLIDCNSHKVLKPLKRYADNRPKGQLQSVSHSPTNSMSSQIKEHLIDDVRSIAFEAADRAIDRGVDKFVYEMLPHIWHEHIVPFGRNMKDILTAKKLEVHSIKNGNKGNDTIEPIPKRKQSPAKMTEEEAEAEKRKVVYHWLAMMDGLRKLQNADVIDMDTTLEQLTNPVMLQEINSYLDANPKLLEMDEYLTLRELLGRDLYEEKQFVPIQAKEIEIIAASYEQEAAAKNSEG